ncbi:hypothetical protein VQ042_01235 [Aurantimonas sp. A2-1-M11]|uniref:hypothetical protein n=1 Tax=Aurantimonas sp. A2-1-M11 TaxID=3113712 RepID=UPI002F924F65
MIVRVEKKGDRTIRHEIDPAQVDSLDEIDGNEQLALVWCETHEKWEWHWIDLVDLQ